MAIAMALGTNESVASWIWVTDWKSEMPNPTASAVSRIGAHSLAARIMACRPISMTVWSFMRSPPARRSTRSRVARHERVHDESPAVDEHEQQQLERQRHG